MQMRTCEIEICCGVAIFVSVWDYWKIKICDEKQINKYRKFI